jgi:hypothetical protein
VRRIPYILLGLLVVLSGAFAVISIVQSNSSGSSDSILTLCAHNLFTVKPSTYVISCADANSEFTNSHWFGWGDATAYATGEARWNDCQPTCVAGQWHSKPVTMWAWDLRTEGHRTAYTKIRTTSKFMFSMTQWGTNGEGVFEPSSST